MNKTKTWTVSRLLEIAFLKKLVEFDEYVIKTRSPYSKSSEKAPENRHGLMKIILKKASLKREGLFQNC